MTERKIVGRDDDREVRRQRRKMTWWEDDRRENNWEGRCHGWKMTGKKIHEGGNKRGKGTGE